MLWSTGSRTSGNKGQQRGPFYLFPESVPFSQQNMSNPNAFSGSVDPFVDLVPIAKQEKAKKLEKHRISK